MCANNFVLNFQSCCVPESMSRKRYGDRFADVGRRARNDVRNCFHDDSKGCYRTVPLKQDSSTRHEATRKKFRTRVFVYVGCCLFLAITAGSHFADSRDEWKMLWSYVGKEY
jgi:hypothetical protein